MAARADGGCLPTALCGAINGSDKRAFPSVARKQGRKEGQADKSRDPFGPGVIRTPRKQVQEAVWASVCLYL